MRVRPDPFQWLQSAESSLREPQQVCDFLEEFVVCVVAFKGGTGCGLHRSRKRLYWWVP